MNFQKVYEERNSFVVFQKIYEAYLREMRVNQNEFTAIVHRTFVKSLPPMIFGDLLPNDFLTKLSRAVILIVVKDDSAYDGEGVVLVNMDGTFRRGAFALTIKSFVDTVIERCTTYAKNLRKRKTYFEDYEKVFMQTFLDGSIMNKNVESSWKAIFRDNLTRELEKGEKLSIEDTTEPKT